MAVGGNHKVSKMGRGTQLLDHGTKELMIHVDLLESKAAFWTQYLGANDIVHSQTIVDEEISAVL